ncbi:MAG: cobalamin biosynthesis protein CobQ [Henriciella sp.]
MNTIAHMVIASAALSRPASPRRNWAVLIGAILPDASMFVFFAWSRLQGWSGDETWNVQYWNEPWQTLSAISNSFVLFGLLFILALWRRWPTLWIIAIAALLHLALDFPLHADDAHRHFWPVSDWRFASPVSYWDPRFNGMIGAGIETGCALAGIALLWWRFKRVRWRALFGVLAALQILAFGAQLMWTPPG